MSIHQKVTIPADPHRVYKVLNDAEALSALSGMSGKVASTEGEQFAAFDGNVTGRQIELVPDTRIVQTWRFPRWEASQHSLVTFTLTAVDGGTCLAIDQHGEPDDWHEHIAANWPTFYFNPLTEHFTH